MSLTCSRCARTHNWVWLAAFVVFVPGVIALFVGCANDRQAPLGTSDTQIAAAKPGDGSNNLSYPVIWAEGVQKTLPGITGNLPSLGGAWWFWWGTEGVDPNIVPLSCEPLLDPETLLCLDGTVPGVGYEDDLVLAYLQKDPLNIWQAGSGTPTESGVAEVDGRVYVDWIDWGDNLESVDWYTKSMVRTEVVLFEENPDPGFTPTPDYNPWLEYGMRHTSGWGADEVHGLAASLDIGEPEIGPGTMATVYSPCARFMIQLLLVERDDTRLADLIWVPEEGWTEPAEYPDDLISPPIFNGAVHEAGDGPGYYNAEINVKGRIIYGYTWNVRRLNDGAGDYRLTFSFDETCGGVALNTAIVDGYTQIIVPLEEEGITEEPGGGGTAMLDFDNNLTFMDIRILERGGGGSGGRPKDNPGGGGNGGGNH